MTEPNDLDDQAVIEDLVDDAIVADPNAIAMGFTGHRDATRRKWVASQQVDRRATPALLTSTPPGSADAGPFGALQPENDSGLDD